MISPGVPLGTMFPFASTIFAVTWGRIFPTVSTRLMIGSAGVVWNDTGLRNGEAGKNRVSGRERYPHRTWQSGALHGRTKAVAHLVSAEGDKVKSDEHAVW